MLSNSKMVIRIPALTHKIHIEVSHLGRIGMIVLIRAILAEADLNTWLSVSLLRDRGLQSHVDTVGGVR